jgi:hypothetical protein
MYVWVCVCVHVCMYVCACVNVHMYVRIYLFIYSFIIHLHLGVQVFAYCTFTSEGKSKKVLAVLNIAINISKRVEGNGCGDSIVGAFVELLAKFHPEVCLLSEQRNPVHKKP